MLLLQIVMMNECGKEYIVRQGKSYCKEIEDTVSSVTSSRHEPTDVRGKQDSTAVVCNPGCTLQSSRGALKQTPMSGPHVQEILINCSGG